MELQTSREFWPRRPVIRCQLVRNNKFAAGIAMAVPFVGCFALFGICNLVAGTIVTIMACKGRLPLQADDVFHNPVMLEQSQRVDSLLDPMKIVGPILLITGATLVFVGLLLGVIACRSAIHVHQNRRPPRNVSTAAASFVGLSGPASFAGIGNAVGNNSACVAASQSPKRAHSLSGNIAPNSRRGQRHSSPEFYPTVTLETPRGPDEKGQVIYSKCVSGEDHILIMGRESRSRSQETTLCDVPLTSHAENNSGDECGSSS